MDAARPTYFVSVELLVRRRTVVAELRPALDDICPPAFSPPLRVLTIAASDLADLPEAKAFLPDLNVPLALPPPLEKRPILSRLYGRAIILNQMLNTV